MPGSPEEILNRSDPQIMSYENVKIESHRHQKSKSFILIPVLWQGFDVACGRKGQSAEGGPGAELCIHPRRNSRLEKVRPLAPAGSKPRQAHLLAWIDSAH
jgi:hypothetical protein